MLSACDGFCKIHCYILLESQKTPKSGREVNIDFMRMSLDCWKYLQWHSHKIETTEILKGARKYIIGLCRPLPTFFCLSESNYCQEINLLASCPWGPATVHGVGILTALYVIYMGTYVSHCAIARCFGLGLFYILHLASHNGSLPTVGNLSKWCARLIYNIWQTAKNSWHTANSTPFDPPCSWSDTYLTSITKNGPEKAHFRGFFTLTLDLWPWFTKNQYFIHRTYLGAKYEGPGSNGSTFLRLRTTESFLGNIYGFLNLLSNW